MSDEQNETAADPLSTPENEQERLQAALDSPCVVRLHTGRGRTTASIPELGILTSANSVEIAHAEALRRREACIREFASAGLLDELPTPGEALSANESGRRLLPQLKVFLVKAAVVAALFLYGVNIIGNGLRDVGYVLEKKLDSVVTWTPETVEKHRAKAAQVAEKLGPVLRTLMSAFERPSSAARPEAVGNNTARP